MFNAQLVAALPDGCSSLHQEGVEFFPPSTEPKFARIWTKEMFNAQLVAALPDGCSSLHQEGVEFFPPSTEPNLQGFAQLVEALPDGCRQKASIFPPKY